MKKFLFPVAVILMGTGAAFATNHAEVNGKKASVDAYRIDNVTGECADAEQQCSDFAGPPCVWTGDNTSHLVEKISDNPTMCGNELFRIQ